MAYRAEKEEQRREAAHRTNIEGLLTKMYQLRPLVDDSDGEVAQLITEAEAHLAKGRSAPQ
jgi:hypothetical protein